MMNIIYPSLQGQLIMPEYGRNIQRMVEYAISLPSIQERNHCADTIVRTMMQLHPELNNAEKQHTFYDHLALISDFKLDIDYPFGNPQPEELALLPAHLQYQCDTFPFRHYGKIIQAMIAEAIAVEEVLPRQRLIILIANRLKYTYLVWNKDSVEDDIIIADIERLSHGQLSCDFPGFELLSAKQLAPQKNEKTTSKKKKKK